MSTELILGNQRFVMVLKHKFMLVLIKIPPYQMVSDLVFIQISFCLFVDFSKGGLNSLRVQAKRAWTKKMKINLDKKCKN